MKNLKIVTLSIISALTLSGCYESRLNTDQLCERRGELRCDSLNMRDGQCKIPRTDLIWHRYEISKAPTIEKVITEFELVTVYQTCLDLAAQIQPISSSSVKERRFLALLHTKEEQVRITEQLQNSNNPSAYYFLWSKGDMSARRKFLQLEGTQQLNTSAHQYQLASYYIKRDPEKAVNILQNALVLTESPEVFNTKIIQSLASSHHGLGNKERAYIWAQVGKDFKLPITSDQNLKLLYPFTEEKLDELKDIAKTVTKSINSGKYKRNTIPSDQELAEL